MGQAGGGACCGWVGERLPGPPSLAPFHCTSAMVPLPAAQIPAPAHAHCARLSVQPCQRGRSPGWKRFMAHPMTLFLQRVPTLCVCTGLTATAEWVQHLHRCPIVGLGSTAASPGTEGVPRGHPWDIAVPRATGRSGRSAGTWPEWKLAAGALPMLPGSRVMLPDTDLPDPALLLSRKGGPQSCSQCLHRAPLCMEGQTVQGEGAHWISVSWSWHPMALGGI